MRDDIFSLPLLVRVDVDVIVIFSTPLVFVFGGVLVLDARV